MFGGVRFLNGVQVVTVYLGATWFEDGVDFVTRNGGMYDIQILRHGDFDTWVHVSERTFLDLPSSLVSRE